MEESNEMDDLLGNVLKKNSLHPGGYLKGTATGKAQSPRGSPSFRRVRTPRKDFSSSWWNIHCLVGNRLVFLLILCILWMYLWFCVQLKWARVDDNKPELFGYMTEEVGNAQNVFDVSRTIDALIDSPIDPTILDSVILKHGEEMGSMKMVRRGRHRLKKRLPKNDPLDKGVPRRNTSYGWVIGPFSKTEDGILGWNANKRNGKCDRNSEFGRLVWSRRFVLIIHELSMTGAPLSMMELATEILNCGGSVSVVVLSRKGGLMKELNRRRIRVLKDRGEMSYKIAMRSDLIVAGSAVCSSWIEQYLLRFRSRSTQILWWIMENRREYFDRSKHLLNQVKMLIFLAETQSEQWIKWCEEEDIQLKIQPKTVPLSVNDELLSVAGIPCYLNTPFFKVENMQAKRKLLRLAVREELGLADDDMLVITLSSINPGKGQKLLLESVILRDEQKPPLIDLKINSMKEDKYFLDATMQDENHIQNGLHQNYSHAKELESILLRTNRKARSDARKKRRKDSRLSSVHSIKSIQHQDTRRLRNLLSNGEDDGKEPTLKVLIGSVGSKSNKILYIKRILRYISENSSLCKSLLWTPATTHVSSIYAAADVYVINAQGLGETFGRVTIEAMAFGLPVLGTDAGGTREIVEDKVTGLLHPIGQEGIKPLAQNLQFLLSNPSAREQLGKNGRLKVEKMYMKQHMYKKLAEAFIQCMRMK